MKNHARGGIIKVRDLQKPIYYFLPMFAGLYAFLLVIALFLPGGIVEEEETFIFVLSWPAAILAAVLYVILLNQVQQKYFRENDHPLWILLALDALFFTLLATSLYVSWQPGKSLSSAYLLIYSGVFILPLASALLIRWMKSRRFNFPITRLYQLSLLGCLGFIWFIDPFQVQFPHRWLIMALLGGTAIAIFNRPFPANPRNRALQSALDFFVIFMIILACFDPAFTINPHHQNFYLGPVNRILHGGTVLVDTFSQYGVLVLYFIAIIFKTGMIPFTYQGFSLVVALLLMLHFSMVYLVLIGLFRNRLYAILLLSLIMLLGLFGTSGILQAFPSTGPLRFELGYLMLVVVYIRKRLHLSNFRAMFLEYCLLGIASLWSFETFVYTVFPYMGICLYESFLRPMELGQSIRNLSRRLLWLLISLAIFQTLFALFTFFLTRQWPDWGAYLGYINAYSSLGSLGTLLIYPWGPWFLLIIIYLAALVVFLVRSLSRRGFDDSPERMLIFGLALFGIATFTYFLGRSHPNNLFHISTPAVIIAGYAYVTLNKWSSLPKLFHSASTFLFYSSAFLIFLLITPIFLAKASQNNAGYEIAGTSIRTILQGREPALLKSEQELLRRGSGDQQVAEALHLLKKYTPNESRVTVFLSSTNTTEILMSSGRIHTFPINDLVEDLISEQVFQEISNYPQPLKINDFIFLAQNPLTYKSSPSLKIQLSKLQIYLIDRLCQDFNLKEVETSPSGVSVMKLRPQTAAPSFYCKTIGDLKAGISN